jgi:hypothetical protein
LLQQTNTTEPNQTTQKPTAKNRAATTQLVKLLNIPPSGKLHVLPLVFALGQQSNTNFPFNLHQHSFLKPWNIMMQQIIPLPPNVVNRGTQAQSSQGSPQAFSLQHISTITEQIFPIQGQDLFIY